MNVKKRMNRIKRYVLLCGVSALLGMGTAQMVHAKTANVYDSAKQEIQQTKNVIQYIDCNPYESSSEYTNYIIVGFQHGVAHMEQLRLEYTDGTNCFFTENVNLEENSAVFFLNQNIGTYQLTKLSYTQFGSHKEVNLQVEDELITSAFSVKPTADDLEQWEEKAQAMASYLLPTASKESEVYLEYSDRLLEKQVNKAINDGKKVIVLDPGHGGNSGANRTVDGKKIYEDNYAMSMALACFDELRNYSNVAVYLTRSANVSMTLESRTEKAGSLGACMIVSFHLNSTNETVAKSACGAEVIHQNRNYKTEIGDASKALSQKILKYLVDNGAKNRGVYSKNSTEGKKFPDGSAADNFHINRDSKLRGFIGIIIEHCFINSMEDYNKFLSSDAKLKKVGIADARGIAEYLGLKRLSDKLEAPKDVKIAPTSGNGLKVTYTYDGKGEPTNFYLYRSTSENGTYQKVASVDGKQTTIKDFSCERGKMYYYRVAAVNQTGDAEDRGDYSSVVSYFMMTTPTISTVETTNDNKVHIKWAGIKGATGYEVSYATSPTGAFTSLGIITQKEYYDEKANGKTYFYRVRAVKQADNKKYVSLYSVVHFEGTTLKEIHRKSSTINKVIWNPAKVADGYRVYRKADSEKSYTLIAEVAAVYNQYLDTNVQPDKGYSYRISNYVSTGSTKKYEGIYSILDTEARLKNPVINYALPDETGAVSISFQTVENATKYEIYRLNSPNEEWTSKNKIASLSEKETSYKDTKAKKGQLYYYGVMAYQEVNGKQNTSFPEAMELSGVVVKAIVTYSESGFIIGWEKASNAQGYYIYRSEKKAEKGSLIATVSAEKDSYIDSKVDGKKTYYYRVYPYRADDVLNPATDTMTRQTFVGSASSFYSGSIVAGPRIEQAGIRQDSIMIQWLLNKKVTGYQLYRGTNPTAKFKLVAEIKDGSITFFEDKNVSENTVYYYKIRGILETNGVKGRTGFCPIVTSGVEVKEVFPLDSYKIQLKWEPTKMFVGVRVERRKKGSTDDYKQLKNVLASKGVYVDDTVSAGVDYEYRLTGYIKSNGKVIDTQPSIVYGATLSKPKAVSVISLENGEKQIRWTQQIGATGYQLYRSETGESGTYKKILTIEDNNITSYKDKTAQNKAIYYYKIRAFAQSGTQTTYSSYGYVGISGVTPCRIQAKDSSTVVVTWDLLDGAKSYTLYVKKPNATEYEKIKTYHADKLTESQLKNGKISYKDTTVEQGKSYEYRVVVSDGTYSSDMSSCSNFTVMETAQGLKTSIVGKYNGITLNWTAVEHATAYEVYRCANDETEFSLLITCEGKDNTEFKDTSVKENKKYYYRIRGIGKMTGVTQYGSFSDMQEGTLTLTTIMGDTKATKKQIVDYYKKSGRTFPSLYAKEQYGGVEDIEAFVDIIIEEATMEGVKADLLAAQIFKETGYLQFGGDVKASQCNFGGIGAVGGGASGATFPDVRTGIRAQVQHLKAYAQTNPTLSNKVVDPRYEYVSKGCAKYIEWLGISENPEGKGWATASKYGVSIVAMMNAMRK